jgi:hypothetical protein
MADVALPTAPRPSIRARPGRVGLLIAGLVVAALISAWFTGAFNTAGLANFMVVFSSLLIGAVPLVMLGAFVAACIGTFVPESAFIRIGHLPEPLQIPVAGLAGFAFPVCECGSVPVARRLVARGLIPSAAVTFMLAAPILNPIVVLSTSVAYRGRDVFWPMVLGRIGLGFIAAMAVGWAVGARNRDGFLRAAPDEQAHVHVHVHADASCDCAPGDDDHVHHHDHGSTTARFFGYFAGDFVYMGRFLILGAAVAAALQTLVPQSVLGGVADTPVVNLLAMMALAFALSLCSESDAFVAASFVQFGVGPQLAFLVFGPMMDSKLVFLYNATFSKGFVRIVLAVVTGVTLVGTLWVEVLFG